MPKKASETDRLTGALSDMGSRNAISMENRASEIGAIETWAYHCYRCNYTWLPKDYDVNHSNLR